MIITNNHSRRNCRLLSIFHSGAFLTAGVMLAILIIPNIAQAQSATDPGRTGFTSRGNTHLLDDGDGNRSGNINEAERAENTFEMLGDDNRLFNVFQTGDTNQIQVRQEGDRNQVGIEKGAVAITQSGTTNLVDIDQVGDDNTVTNITQTGNGNTLDIDQGGTNNTVDQVYQERMPNVI